MTDRTQDEWSVRPIRPWEGMSMSMKVRDLAALCAYLRLAGLSQRALAVRAGVAPATVNHLLSGRRSCCSRPTATAIEQALRCPPGLFFAEMGAQARAPGVVLAAGTSRR